MPKAGNKQEKKLQNLGKIYENSATAKKGANVTGKKRSKIPQRGKSQKAARKDLKSEGENGLEEGPKSDADITESMAEGSERDTGSKISLPSLAENRPATQKGDDPTNTGQKETVSFPMISARNDLVSQGPKIDRDDEDGASEEKKAANDSVGGRNSEQTNAAEEKTIDRDAQKSIGMLQKRTSFQSSVGKLGNKNEDQAQIDKQILEKMLKNKEQEANSSSKTAGLFKRAAKISVKAAMFSNFLMEDLNLRYLQAVYDDPDYNDKYTRIRTPDIETDEEKDNALLEEIQADYSTSERQTESEVGNDDSSSSTESETEKNESDTDAGSPFKVPDDIKELIENEKAEDKNDLVELGIWKEEEQQEEAADDEKKSNASDDADDEKSEDDWSINTAEEDDDDNDSETEKDKKKKKIPEEAPKPSKSPPRPYKVALPTGDTPDILLSSSEESVCTIYASHIDEYESDVFGSRLQYGMFYQPPSQKSDAGDSDMFYCVPNVAVSYYPTGDYLARKNGAAGKKPVTKVKKIKKRKELNEQFLRSAMKKHAVQDTAIAKYGNATKAFRLRMAKLGKDPKETDNKINAKIEMKLRRRLRRKHTKTDELTKHNVKKLPNLSKKAKIMRWVKLYDKKGMIKTFYENGWVENPGGPLQPTIDRTAVESTAETTAAESAAAFTAATTAAATTAAATTEAATTVAQDLIYGVINRADTIENETVYNDFNENRMGEEGDINKLFHHSIVDENVENQEGKNSIMKRSKSRKKRRKMSEVMKKRLQEKLDGSSDESFVIAKEWQISVGRTIKVADNGEEENGELEEEEYPRSDHAGSKIEEESTSGENASGYASSYHSEANMDMRIATPFSEPEEIVVVQEPIRPEKPKRRHSIGSRWGLVPNLILSKKKNTLNNEMADVTRLLFEQLSLKTKLYSKLPPIKRRSGANSKGSNRSLRTDRTGSDIHTSRYNQPITLGTP